MVKLFTEIKYSLRSYFRNKGAVFWTLVFPVILLLLLGYVLGGGNGVYNLYYVDSDNTDMSHALLDGLKGTHVVNLTSGDSADLAQKLKDGKIAAYIVIPKGFEQAAGMAKATGTNSTVPLEVYYDKSQTSSLALLTIISQVMDGLNLGLANAKVAVGVVQHDVATSSMSYLAFLLPGIIGMSIMSSAVNGTVGTMAHNRATGVFRKLATTPMSRISYNAGRIITQTVILLISTAVALLIGYLVFGVVPNINAMMVVLVIAGGAVFAGLGMIIASFIKDEETAANAASALTFPLMFVSGTFLPVDQMPWFLQYLADVSPLTYLNNGLRSAMITSNYGDAFTNLLIVAGLGIALFVVGVIVMKWKED